MSTPDADTSADHSEAEPVIVRRESRAIAIEFDRPAKRNALDRRTSALIKAALERYADVSLPLVFRSRKPGLFVSGSDVAELQRRTLRDSLSRLNGRVFQAISEYPWPTVSVVEGHALGGGCELALACDLRITTENAVWGLPETTLGLVPSAGALTRLAELIGAGMATDLILTGRRVTGREAGNLGLASRVVSSTDLDAQLDRLLTELARGSTLAQRLAKEAMRVRGDRNRLVDAASQALCLESHDTQERLHALLERHSSQPSDT